MYWFSLSENFGDLKSLFCNTNPYFILVDLQDEFEFRYKIYFMTLYTILHDAHRTIY